MKLTVLTENSVLRSDLKAEHGMSILVQADGINFLFDTGYFGAIRENAQKLGIDLKNIDVVAFSHNHVDHTGGFLSICDLIKPDCKIYAHKGFNIRKYWDHRFDPITDITAAQNLEQVGPAMQSEYFFQNQKYNFLSLCAKQRGAHFKSSHTAGVCGLFYPFSGTKPTRSLTTSPPMIRPATEGTKALEPGTERRWVHLRWVPGGQMQ